MWEFVTWDFIGHRRCVVDMVLALSVSHRVLRGNGVGEAGNKARSLSTKIDQF